MLGASTALLMSKIPFANPVAAVRVARIQDQWVLNPTFQQLEYSDVDIVVAGTENGILMVEGGSMEISEEDVADALEAAHAGIRELCALQREFVEPVKQPEMQWTPVEPGEVLRERVMQLA